jgi:hypothetical protein
MKQVHWSENGSLTAVTNTEGIPAFRGLPVHRPHLGDTL